MGQVWSADDARLRRAVAVKVLSADLGRDPRALARFRREAEAAAKLDHPGITSVYDVNEHNDHPYIVMQLLSGSDLDALRREQPDRLLDAAQVVELMAQAADALAYAHSHGVVHRDIKPSNLMCSPGGGVKICDFGLARDLDASTELTLPSTVMGTPAYMAPEQWRAEPATVHTDLYAFGATLHTLLTGVPPFPGPSVELLRHQHLNAGPPRLADLRPDLPGALNDLLQRLLAKQPADRHADAAQVAQTLRGVLRDVPHGPASSPSEPIQVWMPQLDERVHEGTVTRWLKNAGDQVTAGEPLLEFSTGKVGAHVPAPADGTVASVAVAAGQTVPVGAALATIQAADGRRPTDLPPRPSLKITASRWAQIVSATEWAGVVGFWFGAVVGGLSSLGKGNEPPFTSADASVATKIFMGGLAGGVVAAAVLAVFGVMFGALPSRATFTVDADKLAISPGDGGTLTIHWSALERISIDTRSSAWMVIAWFRSSRQPSKEWIEEHHVTEVPPGYHILYTRRAGPGQSLNEVLRADRLDPLKRLRTLLPHYAEGLYDETGFTDPQADRLARMRRGDRIPDP